MQRWMNQLLARATKYSKDQVHDLESGMEIRLREKNQFPMDLFNEWLLLLNSSRI